jgi:hypothetical protein
MAADDRHSAEYIDETGPGQRGFLAALVGMIGDRVAFCPCPHGSI